MNRYFDFILDSLLVSVLGQWVLEAFLVGLIT
jgi:hypothetical protein